MEIVFRKYFVVFSALLSIVGSGLALAQSLAPQPYPNLDLLTNGQIYAIAHQPNGGIVVGGAFSSVNGIARENLARLKPDLTLDTEWKPSANSAVHALAIDANGDVFAGGYFTRVDGEPRAYIAKISGSAQGDVDPSWIVNADNYVLSLAIDVSGAVFAGVGFTTLGVHVVHLEMRERARCRALSIWLAAAA